MPDHIRLILKHAAIGFCISLTFTGLLLWLNIANLWHLVTHTSEGPIAVIMLVVFGTITFGSAQIGYKIMSMGEEEDDTDRGARAPQLVRDPQPIAVPVERDAPAVQRL